MEPTSLSLGFSLKEGEERIARGNPEDPHRSIVRSCHSETNDDQKEGGGGFLTQWQWGWTMTTWGGRRRPRLVLGAFNRSLVAASRIFLSPSQEIHTVLSKVSMNMEMWLPPFFKV